MSEKLVEADNAFPEGVHVVILKGKKGPRPMAVMLPRHGACVVCFTSRKEAEDGADRKGLEWERVAYYDPDELYKVGALASSQGMGIARCSNDRIRPFDVVMQEGDSE